MLLANLLTSYLADLPELYLVSIYLSICPSIYPFSYLSIYPSIYLSIYPAIYLSVYLSMYLSIYLSVIAAAHGRQRTQPAANAAISCKVNVLEASRARQNSRKPKARVNSRTGLSPVHYLTVTRTVTGLVVAVIYKPTHCAQSPQLEFELVHAPSLEPRGLVALKKKQGRERD